MKKRSTHWTRAAILAAIGAVPAACSSTPPQDASTTAPDASLPQVAITGDGADDRPTVHRIDGGVLEVRSRGMTRYLRPVCDGADPSAFKCHSYVESDRAGTPAGLAQPGPGLLGAADLQSAYAIPTYVGTKGTIAILGLADSPNFESDLASYRTAYGLPACTSASGCFTKVNGSGAAAPLDATPNPGPDGGGPGWDAWTFEQTLDITMASVACPTCKILLVEATNNDLVGAAATAARLGASVASFSGGLGEFSGQTAADSQFAATGIGLFAAAGDNGWHPAGEVWWPAVSTAFTSVGGTFLTPAPGTMRGWSESAWMIPEPAGSKLDFSTGWGCSSFEPKPAWQKDLCANRSNNDVSAVAGTSVAIFYTPPTKTGSWFGVEGTSVASPLVAGIYALTGESKVGPGFSYVGQPGGATSAGSLYFNDVTTGAPGDCDGSYCNTGPGYDAPTGNGTPVGSYLAANGPLRAVEVNWVYPAQVSLLQGNTASVQTYVSVGNATPLPITNLPAGVTATESCSATTYPTGTICTIKLTATPAAAVGQWTVSTALAIGGAQPANGNFELLVDTCTPARTCSGTNSGGLPIDCGTQTDGCGGTIACGTCASGVACTNGSCCNPKTVAQACGGLHCGYVPDGCGSSLRCPGTCNATTYCSAGSCIPVPPGCTKEKDGITVFCP